ncbi:uncharacterized protein LOC130791613 [Actinidia eriantha]|uniref:uncharacterized protein LOC130791613 n=1 Tax=Actinidia eriantha TaxID=165200 RepID=UPI002586DB51|nr:uncharacterized protein LOC130791613 [Actinidia eriantha]
MGGPPGFDGASKTPINGKTFNQVEIKPEMIGHYLAGLLTSSKPVKHGSPSIGATDDSRGERMVTGRGNCFCKDFKNPPNSTVILLVFNSVKR